MHAQEPFASHSSPPAPHGTEATSRSLAARGLARLHAWHEWQRQAARLGSAAEPEYERSQSWFVAQGGTALPRLRRMLRGSSGVACGAAAVLYRLGDAGGMRQVLTRCYEEEWLTLYRHNGLRENVIALRRLGRGAILAVAQTALADAMRTREEADCMPHLVVVLSSLRALAVFPLTPDYETASWELWEQCLRFGPLRLQTLKPIGVPHPLINNMTGWIRAEAIRRLLDERPLDSLVVLQNALRDPDRHVSLSAIEGLQRLGDPSIVPELEAIAFTAGHPLALRARRAIENLAGAQTPSLVLIRPSHSDPAQDELLRAAIPLPDRDRETDAHALLHVSEQDF
jgi:hypothetical protein